MKHARAKNRTGPSDGGPRPEAATGPAAGGEGSHYPMLFGVMLGLILLAFFIYPAAAYPAQAMMLSAIMLAAAAGLAVKQLRAGGPARTAMLSALGGLPALGGLLFVLWAVVRWRQAEVPALERDWIVSLLAFAVAFVLGCGAGVLDRAEPGRPAAFTMFTRVVAIGAAGYGLYALYQYFISYPAQLAELRAGLSGPINDYRTQSLEHAFLERRVGGTLGNGNLYAAQLAVFAFLALALAGRDQERGWRVLGWLGAAAALAGALLTGSRGGMLTMLLALGWAAALLLTGRRWKMRKPSAAVVMLIAGMTLMAVGRVWAAEEGLAQRLGNIATIRERLFYWQIALKVWARHWWIGEGPGGFQLLYLTLKDPVARESQYAHSWIFQVGSELGLVGLGLLCCFWGGTAARVAARWRRGDLHPGAAWCAGALLILAFNGLFEFSLQWHAFLVAAGVLGGLASGLTAPGAEVEPLRGSEEEMAQPRVPQASPGATQLGPLRGPEEISDNPHSKGEGPVGLRDRIPHFPGWFGVALAGMAGVLAVVYSPAYYKAEKQRWNGSLAMEDERWADAVGDYARAVKLLPDDPSLRMALASALGRVGAAAQGWEQLGEAARLNPRSAAVRDVQATWLERQGQLEQAIELEGEAIVRYPTNVAYRLARARLLLKAGRDALAREDLSYIEKGRLPVWKYQQDDYLALRAAAGLAPIPVEQIPS